jgi:dTDP-4-dehydrorhamnose reductase
MVHKNILVTGANGQLGNELRGLEENFPNYKFFFTDVQELAIDDASAVKGFFRNQPLFACVNCAAYTAVDKAESEKEKVMLINANAVGNLAEACAEYATHFIHISTDYVFDGNSEIPYREDDPTNPVNHYGLTKLYGEKLALEKNPSTIIIRTSWVYSEYGNNFVKTMMRLMKERESINVVNDQLGSPTYAADLADAIMKIISMIDDRWQMAESLLSGFDEIMSTESFSTAGHAGPPNIDQRPSTIESGIFHYSNEGTISWYEFAVAIKELIASPCKVNPIPTTQYPTPARRPHYSMLDKSKIKTVYNLKIPHWRDSLASCVRRIQNPESRFQN